MNALLSDLASRDGLVTSDAEPALRTLLSRASCWPLIEPAPTAAQMDIIFNVALRAPDHGRLRPWRFVTISGDARAALGDTLVDLASRRDPTAPRASFEHRRQKAFAAPVIIAIGAAVTTATKVPEIEQLMSVGAATMNMLNAIHALGYGGFWATGPDSYEASLHEALGFTANERLLGFLFVGTPQEQQEPPARPDIRQHVRDWQPANRR